MFFKSYKIYKDINTKRLILREPKMSDLNDVFEFCGDSASTKYVNWEPHRNKSETAAYIKYLRKEILNCNPQNYTWFVWHKEDKKVVATVSLVELDTSGKIATIGYTFSKRYQHKGLAAESVSAVIKYLFGEREVERVQAQVLPLNTPSINLLERVGMKKEAFLKKGVFCKNGLADVLIYSILKEPF